MFNCSHNCLNTIVVIIVLFCFERYCSLIVFFCHSPEQSIISMFVFDAVAPPQQFGSCSLLKSRTMGSGGGSIVGAACLCRRIAPFIRRGLGAVQKGQQRDSPASSLQSGFPWFQSGLQPLEAARNFARSPSTASALCAAGAAEVRLRAKQVALFQALFEWVPTRLSRWQDTPWSKEWFCFERYCSLIEFFCHCPKQSLLSLQALLS